MEKEKEWLNENGLQDLAIGDTSLIAEKMTGEKINNPKQVFVSEVMHFWKHECTFEIKRRIKELCDDNVTKQEIYKILKEVE